MTKPRTWNLRLNIDVFNASVAALGDDQERAQFLTGMSCGMNGGCPRPGAPSALLEGFSVGSEMRKEAEAFVASKSGAGNSSVQARLKKYGSAQPTSNSDRTVIEQGSNTCSNSDRTNPQSTIYNPLTTNQPPSSSTQEVQEGKKGKKAPKEAKQPAWMEPFPADVLEAVAEIMEFYPRPPDDLQPPDRTTKHQDPVPETSRPKLAQRLTDIKAEGGNLEVCVIIARRFVEEYRVINARVWMKAAQFFFGSSSEAPWRDLYRAHVTNQAQLIETEEAVANG